MTHRIEEMPAGTTRKLDFNTTYSADWSDAAKAGTNVLAADVSSARFLLKRRLTDADAAAAVTKTTASGITKVNGKLTVSLTPSDTKDLQGKFYGTLRLYLATGAVQDWEDTDYDGVPYIELRITQGAVEAVS